MPANIPSNTKNPDVLMKLIPAFLLWRWIKIVVLACVLAIGSVVLAKFIDVFFPRKVSGPLYLGLYPLFVIAVIYFGSKKQLNKMLTCLFGIPVLCMITYSGIYFHMTLPFEVAKTHLLFWKYENCKRSATSFGTGRGAFNLCELNFRALYSDGIAYDSSDELQNYGRHTHEWIEIVKHYGGFGNTPFKATPIGHHFYYIEFYIEDVVPRLN